MRNTNILFIHGAWATPMCFNYLTDHAVRVGQVADIACFTYDCQAETSSEILWRAKYQLENMSSPHAPKTIIIGHSLGGVLALKLAQEPGVEKIITMASPIAGLKEYNIIVNAILSHTIPILMDLHPFSEMIRTMHGAEYDVPVDVLVSRAGFHPFTSKDTDGVVSIASQTDWTPSTSTIYDVDANHHEILQSTAALEAIERALLDEH